MQNFNFGRYLTKRNLQIGAGVAGVGTAYYLFKKRNESAPVYTKGLSPVAASKEDAKLPSKRDDVVKKMQDTNKEMSQKAANKIDEAQAKWKTSSEAASSDKPMASANAAMKGNIEGPLPKTAVTSPQDDRSRIKEKLEDVKEKSRQTAEDIKEHARDKTRSGVETVKDKAAQVKENINEKVDQVKADIAGKMNNVKEAAKERVDERVENIEEGIKEAKDTTKEAISSRAERAKDVAKGAVVGAAGAVMNKAEDIAEGVKDRTKDTASKLAAATKDKAIAAKDVIIEKTSPQLERAKDTISENAKEAEERIREKGQETAQRLKEGAERFVKDHALPTMEEMKQSSKELGARAMDTASKATTRVRDSLNADTEGLNETNKTPKDWVEKLNDIDNKLSRLEKKIDVISKQ